VKLLMRALGNFKNKILGIRPVRLAGKSIRPSSKPKNGLLILGVFATISMMAALTFLNIKLMRDQTAVNKQCVKESTPENIVTVIPERAVIDSKHENKPRHPTTEVTFYKQLKSEDDGNGHRDSLPHKPKPVDGENSGLAKDEKGFSIPALSGSPCPLESGTNVNLPLTNTGPKIYSVQVGVFSYPRVAQEWAEKWRSRGYPVVLRPIAGRNAGIQYRLFVGEFNSEKKADEFAKQLKAKEGITGLTLVIKE